MFRKIEKQIVFGEGTDLQRLVNDFATVGVLEDVHGCYFDIVETATGDVVMQAPTVVGKAYPFIWKLLSKKLGLTTIDDPIYKDMLFSFEK